MDEIAYRRAKARVEQQLAFYRHLVLYLGVNAFLFAINLWQWNGYLWAKWPAFGWGIGIIVHAMETFSYRWWSSERGHDPPRNGTAGPRGRRFDGPGSVITVLQLRRNRPVSAAESLILAQEV